jgi:hypothetical protein
VRRTRRASSAVFETSTCSTCSARALS